MLTAALLMRLSSQCMHWTCGAFAVFFLYFAAKLPDYHAAVYCFLTALKWGAIACIILFCQCKYLSDT